LSDEPTPTADTSKNFSVSGELYLKPPVNPISVRVFLTLKPGDHSLLALHPRMNNLNVQKHKHFQKLLPSRGEGSDAQLPGLEDTEPYLLSEA
jgi:hypothetical protein